MKEKIDRVSWKPIRVPYAKLSAFLKKHHGVSVIDQYAESIEELFLLRNPKYRFDKNYQADFQAFLKRHTKGKSLDAVGNWFYFPWSHTLTHVFTEAMLVELKTGRNRFLITAEEQRGFYDSTIAIFGMSVGSHVALTIALTGGAKHITLADPDEISGSNLNRIRAGFTAVGLPKVYSVARQIYEMNPYADVVVYREGVTEENLPKILTRNGKIDLLIEEMDNPYLKIRARELTKKLKIPVIMAADNGDNIIVDIERYDTTKNLPLLHGILGKMTSEDFKHIHPKDLPRTIAKMAGANIATLRMQQSVVQVGRSIYSWPQLGTAATLCGTVLAYLTRNILVGNPITSGRFEVNLDSIFEPGYHDKVKTRHRKRETEKFLKKLGITY